MQVTILATEGDHGLPDVDKIYLIAMSVDDGPSRTAQVAQRMGVDSATPVPTANASSTPAPSKKQGSGRSPSLSPTWPVTYAKNRSPLSCTTPIGRAYSQPGAPVWLIQLAARSQRFDPAVPSRALKRTSPHDSMSACGHAVVWASPHVVSVNIRAPEGSE